MQPYQYNTATINCTHARASNERAALPQDRNCPRGIITKAMRLLHSNNYSTDIPVIVMSRLT